MKRDIILIGMNARYSHTNPAVRYLKTYAKREEVKIREYTINNDMEKVFSDLLSLDALCYAFSVYIWNVEYVYPLASRLKEATGATILMGGPEPSNDVDRALKHSDCVIRGEGEEAFKCFCEVMLDGRDISTCPSISYIEDGKTVDNDPTVFVDLDFLSQPYYDLDSLKGRLVYYESSRGCPFSCAYCLSSSDKTLRYSSVEKVKRDLRTFMDAHVLKVKFVDRTFNMDRKRAAEILEFINTQDTDTEFHFEIAADLIDQRFIDAVNASRKGQMFLEIGVQSTYLPTLKAVHRVQDFGYTKDVVRKLLLGRKANVHLDLIAGLPLETYERFRKSFDDTMAAYAPVVQLGFLKVLKGSPMEHMTEEYGIRHADTAPYEVLSTNAISEKELDDLRDKEYLLERIYNSRLYYFFMHAAAKVRESYYKVLEDIVMLIREKGLDREHMSEQELAELLYGYALELREPAVRDGFLLDWYMRPKRAYLSRSIEKSEDWKKDFYNHLPESLSRRIPKGKRPWHYSRVEHFMTDVPKLLKDLSWDERECLMYFDYTETDAKIYELEKSGEGYIIKEEVEL